ncbi:hypothetical protein BJX63DRAFT_427216 [Aspergillus granulosus]|uniref:F-box domain-containing protein n=1 Tax=Aspergillus granulosus TaxID=176169 RepID=A0ABR4I5U0_9EURO
MPDPADLPIELFDQILDAALRLPAYTDYQRSCDFHVGRDVQQFSRLLTVNRSWYDAVAPRLYSRWTYNGTRTSYRSLWRFLRTVLVLPRLAESVQALNIGNWGFYPDLLQYDQAAAEDNVQFTSEDIGLMRGALRLALRGSPNHEVLEAKILEPEALANRDCRPLVLLLLMCLPNLSTLYMHLPETSLVTSVLEEVLRCHTSGNTLPCLANLTQVQLLAEASPQGPDAPFSPQASHPVLTLGDFWPFLWFPALRTLALYDVDPWGAASVLDSRSQSERRCRIEDLRLVIRVSSTTTSSDVQALLALPESLTRFSFYWSHPTISARELWNVVQKHQGTLEHLDVFYDPSNPDDHPGGHFGSLQEFSQLRRLDAQTCILLGRANDDLAIDRLKQTVPQRLDTLVLDFGWVSEGSPTSLTTEIPSIVAERRWPLKVFALNDRDASGIRFHYYDLMKKAEQPREQIDTELEDPGPEPYPGLWSLCKETGTELSVWTGCVDPVWGHKTCHYHRGGNCTWLWRKTRNIRDDGLMRSRMFVDKVPTPVRGQGHGWQRLPKSIHTALFTDHRGDKAFMVFKNHPSVLHSPLPPLFPFVLYFTNPDTLPSPEATGLAGLYEALRGPGPIPRNFHFRLDVYFLPGGTEDDCKAHYFAARASRPNYEILIRQYWQLERRYKHREDKLLLRQPILWNLSRFRPGPGRRPSMAHQHPDLEPYKALLLICPEPNWQLGAQRISCVKFDLGRDLGIDGDDQVAVEDPDISEDEDDHRDDDADETLFIPLEEDDLSAHEDEDYLDEDFGEDEDDIGSAHDSEIDTGADQDEPEPEPPSGPPPESVTISLRISEDSPQRDEDDELLLWQWLEQATDRIEARYDLTDYHRRAVEMGWLNF